MNYYQKLFEEQLHEMFSIPEFMMKVISEKFAENGINLNPEQQAQLKEYFEQYKSDGQSDPLFINVEDDGKISFPDDGGESPLEIDITGTADERIKKVIDHLPELVLEITEDRATPVLKSFKKTATLSISEEKEFLEGFYNRLYETWKKPLVLLEMMISISEGVGIEYNNYVRKSEEILSLEPHKYEVLSRLHARSCQVAKEILVLLKNGFADGAHARWRTLHEVSVVANFIQHHNDEVAEQYLLHDVIERYKEAVVYQKHCKELQLKPISKEGFENLEKEANELIAKYGKPYRCDYGWAAQVLGKNSPTFADVEEAIKMDHIRPYYKLACMNVHAGSHAILFRLGLDRKQINEIMLSGSSNLGLADPGQNTAYSLLMATVSFLMYEPTLDCLISMKALHKLEIEIYETFIKVHRKVYRRMQKEIQMQRKESSN
jgi:hypothetical protein